MYLVSTASFPFKAEDIRKDLGLKSTKLDLLIEGAIASLCALSTRTVRSETWAICDDEKFEERSQRYGTPISIGEPRRLSGTDTRLFRDVTYAPSPEAVAAVRERIIRWCINQTDITDAIAEEAWPTPVTDPDKLGLIKAVSDALAVAAEIEGRI